MTPERSAGGTVKAVAFGAAAFGLAVFLALAGLEVGVRLFSKQFRGLVPQYMIIDTKGELFARSEDPVLLYEMRPNVRTDALGIATATNSLGFRDRDYAIPKPPGVLRIAGVGDSIAFGLDVPLERTFQKRIESRIGALLPGRAVEVVNLGVPGYNTVQEYENLVRKGLRYQPEFAILSYFPDDFYQPKIPRRVEYWRQLLEVHSHLYKWVHQRMRAASARDATGLDLFYGDAAALREGKRALRAIRDLLHARGIGLYVIGHPTLEDEYGSRPHLLGYAREALAGTDTPILDLFPLYRATGRDIRSFRRAPDDFTHPGAEASDLIATWVVDDLAARGLLGLGPAALRTP
jgi:hypothetical protein